MLAIWLNKGVKTAIGLSLCLGVAAAASPAVAAPTSIYAFGDSLTDTGNFTASTFGILPLSPPYGPGRFSNGPLWIDHVTAAYGTQATPSLLGGNNFAYASATTGGTVPPGVTFQTLDYLARQGTNGADPDALYIVYAGSNDVLDELDSTLAPEALAAAATENIQQAITNLAQAGAEYIMVPNLNDLGLTPKSLAGGTETMQRATSLSTAFNNALSGVLAGLEAAFPIDLIPLDVNSLFNAAMSNPAQYGLTNINTPCFSGSIDSPGTVCANPDEYLFWDSVHPTAAAHQFLGNFALAALAGWDEAEVASATDDPLQVPEPATLVMLASGLLGLGLMRTRRRSAFAS
jgi:phospholipase/lecithinase/hemolysin